MVKINSTGRHVGRDNSSANAFDESDSWIGKGRFLFLEKRYLKSYIGAMHGLASIIALIMANLAFFRAAFFRNHPQDAEQPSLLFKRVLYVSTMISGGTVLVFFWNKIQAWQLSTTSMKDKGLSVRTIQNFNRGRGGMALVMHAFYPLVVLCSPEDWLDSTTFSFGVALLMLLGTGFTYSLIKDYGKVVFLLYGGSKLGVSLSIMWHVQLGHIGNIASMSQTYPYVMEFMELEAFFVISCVEFGYLWYYAYSRRLVSREFVQTACKRYHPIMFFAFLVRIQFDAWWKNLPTCTMGWYPSILTVLGVLFLCKIITGLLFSTKVQDKKRRRSSVFEAIDVGLLEDPDD